MSPIEDQSFTVYNAAQCKKETYKARQDYQNGKISAGQYDQPIAACQKTDDNADYGPVRSKNNPNPLAGLQQFAQTNLMPTFKPLLGLLGQH
jgi:hypothetical protein